MLQNADRYLPGPGGPAGYWRRRAIALAVGLAVFGLIAWAVNGTLSKPGSAQTASVTKAPGRARPGAAGTAAAVPASRLSAAALRAGRKGSGHRGGAGLAGGGHQGTRGHHGGGRGGAQGRDGASHRGVPGHQGMPGACPARYVVLSLRQPQRAYGPEGVPSFTAEVISTAPGRCTFNAGRASLALVIRAGQAPLWSSADCARGPAARTPELARGVPALLHFWWDRKTASPGCGRPRRQVRPGTYLATAVSGHTSSNSLTFVLRGRRNAVR